MFRYYVEFATTQSFPAGHYARYELYKIYVYAYSEQQVRDMFNDYELVAIDQTD